jgi:hypothetical protein
VMCALRTSSSSAQPVDDGLLLVVIRQQFVALPSAALHHTNSNARMMNGRCASEITSLARPRSCGQKAPWEKHKRQLLMSGGLSMPTTAEILRISCCVAETTHHSINQSLVQDKVQHFLNTYKKETLVYAVRRMNCG